MLSKSRRKFIINSSSIAALTIAMPSVGSSAPRSKLTIDNTQSLGQQKIYLLSIYTLWKTEYNQEPVDYLNEMKLNIDDSEKVKQQVSLDFTQEKSTYVNGYLLSNTEFAIMAYAGAEYHKHLLT